MQKTAFGNPVLFLDQDAVHHRDLPCRAAKAQHRDPQPDPESLTEADAMTDLLIGDFLACWDVRHFKPVVIPDIGDDTPLISFGTTSCTSDIRFCRSVRHSFSYRPAAGRCTPCNCSTVAQLPACSRSIGKVVTAARRRKSASQFSYIGTTAASGLALPSASCGFRLSRRGT